MCLAIPKKVISVNGEVITVEKPDGACENLKSMVKLDVGDFVLSQQGIIIEKISNKEAEEVIKLFQNKKGGSEK